MAYILIVDDDEDFSAAVAMTLKHEGHDVKVIHEAKLAVPEAGAKLPDLVVLDVMFPEDKTAGFAIARELRELCRDRSIPPLPVVMLTAVNEKFPLGFNPGDIDDDWLPVSSFLEKPVDLDVLAGRVAELLNR